MQPNDFKAKLKEIAEYTVSANKIKRRFFYVCFVIYSWGSDLIASLAGIGIGYPLLSKANNGGTQPNGATPPTGAANQNVLENYLTPNQMLTAGVAMAVFWVVLKLIVNHENGMKRAVMMKNCVKEMLTQRSELLRKALTLADPVSKSGEIAKNLSDIYDLHNREESWPWPGGFAPNIDREVENEIELWYQIWAKKFEGRAKEIPLNPDSDLREE